MNEVFKFEIIVIVSSLPEEITDLLLLRLRSPISVEAYFFKVFYPENMY